MQYAQMLSHVWLCKPMGCSPLARLLCPWNFPGKNTGVGCHFLLQSIFLTQGSNLRLLLWQVDSLPLSHLGGEDLKGLIIRYPTCCCRWVAKSRVTLGNPMDCSPPGSSADAIDGPVCCSEEGGILDPASLGFCDWWNWWEPVTHWTIFLCWAEL